MLFAIGSKSVFTVRNPSMRTQGALTSIFSGRFEFLTAAAGKRTRYPLQRKATQYGIHNYVKQLLCSNERETTA